MLSKLLHPIGLQNEFIKTDSDSSGCKKKKASLNVSNINTDLTQTPALNLDVLKKDDLRKIAKDNKLRITGNKNILVQRIEEHKCKIRSSVVIQCIFRGHLVRVSFRLRGPGFRHTGLCNNQTDFYTLEPLAEIGFRDFYSYADERGFIYGFNVNSLIVLMKNRGNVVNPYNREMISEGVLREIRRLYRVIQIVLPECSENVVVVGGDRGAGAGVGVPVNTPVMVISEMEQRTSVNIIQQYSPFSLQINRLMSMVEYNNRINRMTEIRRKPMNQRIVDLFIEIDLLGNYTQSSWFMRLNRLEYMRLYRTLYDIWSYRGNLSSAVKLRICPLGSPFNGLFTNPIYNQDISLERIQNSCLCVFENMVYTGVDEEHRKLGTLHCLTGLTVVSHSARMAMQWLYESIVL